MSAAIAARAAVSVTPCPRLRTARYVLSGLLLSAFAILKTEVARAAAPAPSQEFWNYLVEFGDAQGAVFDPTDFASVAEMPQKARAEFERAEQHKQSTETAPSAISHASSHASDAQAGQEQTQ